MTCHVGYEVFRESGSRVRSVTFTSRKAARLFQKANLGASLRVVKICFNTGKVVGRGRRIFK